MCIGSDYVSQLITVSPDGILRHSSIVQGSSDLNRYIKEIQEDRDRFIQLFAQADEFADLKTVYTFNDNAEILEKQCEEIGYPNVTTDGELMHNNSHWTDRNKAVAACIESARYRLEACKDNLKEHRERVRHWKRQTDKAIEMLEKAQLLTTTKNNQ